MKLGLEVFLESEYKQFKGKRIGLVTNMTGVNKNLRTSIDLFNEHPDIHLTALYSPEHGIRGDAKAGEGVESSTDPHTQLPVYSLYGKNSKPNNEMLDNIDVIVFDLQDIGTRYYTYIYTMARVMDACGKYNKHFVVLDRPNPITGGKMEGNLVEEDVRSGVGLLPIPTRHGMTVGELAQLYKNEFGYHCELTIVKMENWKRDMYFDQTGLFWVPPSPNTPNIDMAILYPGTCLIEGTNLSEGRGTTKPFEWIGAPFIDGQKLAKHYNERHVPGVLARPISFVPTDQKHEGNICNGVQLHITNRNNFHSLKAGLQLLEVVAEEYPNDLSFRKNTLGKYFFDLLTGTKGVIDSVFNGETDQYLQSCHNQLEHFSNQREPYLLYQ